MTRRRSGIHGELYARREPAWKNRPSYLLWYSRVMDGSGRVMVSDNCRDLNKLATGLAQDVAVFRRLQSIGHDISTIKSYSTLVDEAGGFR